MPSANGTLAEWAKAPALKAGEGDPLRPFKSDRFRQWKHPCGVVRRLEGDEGRQRPCAFESRCFRQWMTGRTVIALVC